MSQPTGNPFSLADINLALVSIARPTFDLALAEQFTALVRAELTQAGLPPGGPDRMISSLEEAAAVAEMLAHSPPDLLLVFQASFADSTMVLELARAVDAPLLLWAVPEARTGGRLRLNSLCGINLGGHALTRAGYRYETIYAAPDDAAALQQVQALAQAGRVRRRLRTPGRSATP